MVPPADWSEKSTSGTWRGRSPRRAESLSSTPLLNIRDYVVAEVTMTANPYFDGSTPGSTTVGVGFAADRHATNPQAFRIQMKVVLSQDDNPVPHPYWFSISITGFFESAERMDSEKTVPRRQIENGLTVLYGVVRGILGN